MTKYFKIITKYYCRISRKIVTLIYATVPVPVTARSKA